MDKIIIQIPYWIIFWDDDIVNELSLNPYWLNEWLVDKDELCTIEITEKTFWILTSLVKYLSHKYNKDD